MVMTIRDEVEAMLSGTRRHILPVAGQWLPGNRSGEYRMRLPVQVGGETGLFDVELTVSPDSVNAGVIINLLAGRSVWRVCLNDVEHTNLFNCPSDIPAMIQGPHYHAWADNRHTGRTVALPQKLGNARILPAEITSNQQAFDWFLEQVNILPPDWEMPEWPIKTQLL